MPEVAQNVDPDKLNAFVGRMLGDLGALTNSVLVHLGDQLGLYKSMSKSGPVTAATLAKETGTSPRLIREWLSAQAAQGYVTYDKAKDEFSLSPEQAMVFADEGSPVFMAGFFDVARGLFDDTPKIANAFRTDGKLAWHEHNGCLFCGSGASSVPPTITTWSMNGCPRSTAYRLNCNAAATSRMSAADTAHPPS